ncbi:M60 family metallopeptidase [Niabella yanshanensis]|uniref:M60 family metallopeptidase n=1 Tax=Niabella yanshanensis TaxID=577386 RepID=A0ABZ0WBA9_9BACT|nr:M60 family metallopeptidase [Niabella yanshanensis]WQD39853.1 M60 family metallopeptidase [Niabella yanshanensis]
MKLLNKVNKAVAITLSIAIFASCGKKSDFGYLLDASELDKGVDSTHVAVDTSRGAVDKSKYLQASIFPGLVCIEEPRVTKTINLDLFYVKSEDLRISVLPRPQFSTGFYAAPGELVTITVPEGVYDLVAQVGAWTDNVGHIENAQRDPVIYSQTKLIPGKNEVRNLYGGHIYILPSSPRTSPVSITFDNVVESPDFVLGVTDPVQWKQKVAASCVPYLELRSKYMIFTVRRDYIVRYPVADPQVLMTEWDRGIKEDFYGWTGLEENPLSPEDKSPQLPYRIVLDVNISAGYGHAGFPIMAINDTYWQTTITDIVNLRSSDVWGLYHEIGHNFQQGNYWSWSTLGETTNNLFIFKLAKRMSDLGLGTWPAKHPALQETVGPALQFAASSNSKDFDNSSDPLISDNPFARLVPFLQMFDKIPADWGYPGQKDGWGIMTELYKRSRRAVRPSSTTLAKHDFVYETVSDYTRMDWQLFFRQWGITLSSTAMDRVAAKNYPVMLQEIWKYNPYTQTGGNTFIDPFASNAWSVIAVSSEEKTGEGPPNGLASSIIDGDLNTFWHSQWSGGTGQPPHTIDMDLSTITRLPITIAGFKYAHRQGVSRPAVRVHIEVSNDKTNWTETPGSPFALAEINGFQTFNFSSPVKARYLRLKYNAEDIRDNPNCALAEFAVFK